MNISIGTIKSPAHEISFEFVTTQMLNETQLMPDIDTIYRKMAKDLNFWIKEYFFSYGNEKYLCDALYNMLDQCMRGTHEIIMELDQVIITIGLPSLIRWATVSSNSSGL